jgi:hypothetical protein
MSTNLGKPLRLRNDGGAQLELERSGTTRSFTLQASNVTEYDGIIAPTGLITPTATITGGSINGTTIGATTASTGAFTTLSATGTVTGGKFAPTANTTAGNGMYLPTTNTLAFSTNGSERFRITADGNWGLRITPSPWDAAFRVLDIGPGSALVNPNSATATWLASNAYFDSVGWKYKGTNFASYYAQNLGGHSWFTAPTGNANDPITFTEHFRITNAGDVGIGLGTTNPSVRLHVDGNVHVSGGDRTIVNRSNNSLAFGSNNTERARIPAAGGFVVGTAALATTATAGFLYVPTCAGTPTGTPATQTGTAPIVIDTTNNKLYFFSGGQWRDAGP